LSGLFESEIGEVHRGTEETCRVVSAARDYLAAVSPASWKQARFDVAAVTDGPDGPVIRYYPGAFDARGNLL